jgi:hypothetical protein
VVWIRWAHFGKGESRWRQLVVLGSKGKSA